MPRVRFSDFDTPRPRKRKHKVETKAQHIARTSHETNLYLQGKGPSGLRRGRHKRASGGGGSGSFFSRSSRWR